MKRIDLPFNYVCRANRADTESADFDHSDRWVSDQLLVSPALSRNR
jgi:hypothetical protein